MAEEEKMIPIGETHETPQAITITIMDPSALGTPNIASSIVTSVEPQKTTGSSTSGNCNLLMVSSSGEQEPKSSILQTVTETHMGTEELPIISSISNPDHDESAELETKISQTLEGMEGEMAQEGPNEPVGQHCLICNIDIEPNEVEEDEEEQQQVPVFKSLTTSTNRRISIFLGGLVGQKLTSRKAHSDIMCRRCFNLLDRVDSLEVEIKETKEEIVNKYQETLTVHGGRARRKKPSTARKSEYVFPKVEPEDEDDQMLGLETDGTFEPRLEDLIEEEHDRREDVNPDDDEWEPEFKRTRIKREIDMDSGVPPKRKRGRPRKDATRPKADAAAPESPRKGVGGGGGDSGDKEPTCPVCSKGFHYLSQVRRHIRYEHPKYEGIELDFPSTKQFKDADMELYGRDDNQASSKLNFSCSWCELELGDEEAYDEHLDMHRNEAYTKYMKNLLSMCTNTKGDTEINTDNLEQIKSEDVTVQETIEMSSCNNTESAIVRKGKKSLKCSDCKFTGQNVADIEEHKEKLHKHSIRICGLCNERCHNGESLKNHLVHHYTGVMVCPICPIKSSIKKHLLSHIKVSHGPNTRIPCKNCTETFTDYEEYEVHQAHTHETGPMRTCEVCEKEVLAITFDKHLANHEVDPASRGESRPHICNLCQASFLFVTQMYHHKYTDHAISFPFQCNECERTFRTKKLQSSHRWGHKFGAHQCPACRLKYRQVDQLKRHMLTDHPDLEGHSCKYCPVMLKNYSTYVAHLKFKHPKEAGYDKKPVRCKLCGVSFPHKVQWKYHMRAHSHSHQTCKICGITVKNLEVHMNLHTKEKKFECRECGAVYHNRASFQFHVKRVHMGEEVRKHVCDFCGKSFLTPADYRIHMSRVHYGERNYWCTICNKGYKSKVSLTYHQRLHTGERPHECNLCGRSFRVPSYLKRHMEHDHRTQYTGVYYKQGRPKNQDERTQVCRTYQHTTSKVIVDEGNGHIPEVVQITVPMEMGEEVISAVTPQELTKEQHLELEQGGVVYVVYEN